MTRIDLRMRPSEAAAWFRRMRQVEERHPTPKAPGETAYLQDAGRCSVDHGNGKVGERKMSIVAGHRAAPRMYYHQASALAGMKG